MRPKIPYRVVPDANIVPDVHDLNRENSLSFALKKILREFKFSSAIVNKSLSFIKRKVTRHLERLGIFPDEIYNLKITHDFPIEWSGNKSTEGSTL